jgi:8-oxo-dGTP diphosphatase
MKPATLCFVFRGDPYQSILLGYKKRGFGQGKWDGFGGKPHADESLVQAAVRELNEECGLLAAAADLIPMGVLIFNFPSKPEWGQEVHVFVARSWRGEPVESEEMRPQWFDLHHIPFEEMWDDSHIWLPHTLLGERIKGSFTMDQDNEHVKEYTLQVL